MKWLAKRWSSMFELRRAGAYEVLLLLAQLKALRDAQIGLTRSAADFQDQACFFPQAMGVEPVGWAAWLPVSLVLSQNFERGVAVVLLVATLVWMAKRSFVIAPITCAFCFGLSQSMQLSRLFNYIHQQLVITWLLMVFAMVCVLRRREFREALRKRIYWTSPIYPVWAGVLVISYLGFQYSYSGLYKLEIGGLNAGSGLKLQLLLVPRYLTLTDEMIVPWAGWPVLNYRWFATLSMTASVILEAGAIVGLSLRWLRPWWAVGLIGMHAIVMLAMSIHFTSYIILLTWLLVPLDRWDALVDALRRVVRARFNMAILGDTVASDESCPPA